LIADGSTVARELRYAAPKIGGIGPDRIAIGGGERVFVRGSNFSPDTLVVVGGVVISGVEIRDTQTLTFVSPALPNGRTTLTLQNRGGIAQAPLLVRAASLDELPAGHVTTFAGGSTYAQDGAAATAAPVFPAGIAIDAGGNILVGDQVRNAIRKVDVATGTILSEAGSGEHGFDGDGGPAVAAALNLEPPGTYKVAVGLAYDAKGSLYFSDSANHRVRRVDASGVITTVAGNGAADFSGDGGPAREAGLNAPNGLAVDAAGNLYIADRDNHRIRRVDTRGTITTVAGNGEPGHNGDNRAASSASLFAPTTLTMDKQGNLYVADTRNHRVRRVDVSTAIISTVAGNGTDFPFRDDVRATETSLHFPHGVALDADGNIYIADTFNNRIRRVAADTGVIRTVAGTGAEGFAGDDGPATGAALNRPRALVLDASGSLFVADSDNSRVRRIDTRAGSISTVAGNGRTTIADDGAPAQSAALLRPRGIAVDSAGNVFVADTENHRIRKVDAVTGAIATMAGGRRGPEGDGGAALSASLGFPSGIAMDSADNLYIADWEYSRIRKVDAATGLIATVAGSLLPAAGLGDNGPATSAALGQPRDVAVDRFGNLYIADTANHRVRRVDAATRVITTIAGTGNAGSSGDGGPALSASLDEPEGVVVDAAGSVYVSEHQGGRIRKIAADGLITTVAGAGGCSMELGENGPATAACLSFPAGIALDAAGNLFVAVSNHSLVRRVDARSGVITTIAGDAWNHTFSGDAGPAALAGLNRPGAIAFDRRGNLFIADTRNQRIRAIRGRVE
jgi:sugar lactone lactonase YvrE